MFRVASKLRFIEPQLPSLVDRRRKGSTGFTKSNTMATAAKSYLSEGKRVCSLGMDTIGLSAIHPSFTRLLTSVAKRQSLMVKRLSRMATELQTSRHLASLCDSAPTESSYMLSICSISTAKTFDNKRSLTVGLT
jgi:hypothetical protein